MKNLITKIFILFITISLIFSLTACDKEAIATLEKEVVTEAEKVEASEVKDQEEEPEIEETEGKKSIAEINAELVKKQKKQDGESEASAERKIEIEKRQELRKRLKKDYKGKSLGKLYPKYTLTWNGVTLEYLPIPDELNPDSEKYLSNFDNFYKKRIEYTDMGYIIESNISFRRNDGKSTHWGAHNAIPGFWPFNKMALGDDVYVTGYKGTTFHYKVIDIIDWYHGGDFNHDKDSFYESLTGNLAKIKGTDDIYEIDEYNPMPIESITFSWCRDDLFKRYIFAVPIEHYEVYAEEGIIDPVD